MDKNWKLQRYDRKDYTELVDFPVEIVGRDGVVRRYTFEDSIRLYQRRITFAPIRYRDNDLIRAEVNHCRSRIDQLRRSYFHRYGWGTPEGQPGAEESFGDLAGELAAFLCRVLTVTGRPEIRFDRVEDAQQTAFSTWYVTPQDAKSGMLLYFYRFGGTSPDESREVFFASLKSLEGMGRNAGDAERLIAFHHTVDCGFVLTGRGADFSSFVQSAKGDARPVDIAPTPWDEILEIVRRGDYEAALRRCRELVVSQPWHRNAYVAGAMLAAFLGEHLVGEDLALVGSRYFPEDGVLLHYLGLCRSRLGRDEDAESALRQAIELSPDLVSARALLAVHLVQRRRHREALDVLRSRRGVDPDDRRADADLQHLEHWIQWRAWMIYGGAAMVLVGLGTFPLQQVAGVAAALLGAFLAGLGWFAFHRQLDSMLARQRFEEISQGLRRLHRTTRDDLVVS
ncbi:MAG: hypothetical protein KTR31_26245 [Myxococcales bacterium]|nr:hypothetical protein [Myxococcales bacterium]